MRTKNILLAVFFFICVGNVCGQAPAWAWARDGQIFSVGNSIATDSYGNCFTTGYFYGGVTFDTITVIGENKNTSIFIVKQDENGNAIWAKSAIGNGADCYAYGITTDYWGDVYITGYFYNTVTFDNITLSVSSNGFGYFIAKYNGQYGYVEWAKTAVGGAMGISIAADSYIYVTGWFGSSVNKTVAFDSITLTMDSTNNHLDFFVVKYDTYGNVIWAKNGGSYGGYTLGSATDLLGGVYISGAFAIRHDSVVIKDAGIVQYDYKGDIQWVGRTNCYIESVTCDLNGNVYAAGYSATDTVKFDSLAFYYPNHSKVVTAKYNDIGKILWARCVAGNGGDEGYGVAADAAGNVYVTGGFRSDSIVFANTVLKLNWNYDAFVAAYDKNGNELWIKGMSGNDEEIGNSIATNLAGDIYVTGHFLSDTLPMDSLALNSPYHFPVCFIGKIPAITVGMNDPATNNNNSPLLIYPNPSTGVIHIVLDKSIKDGEVNVYNVMGERVYSATVGQAEPFVPQDKLRRSLAATAHTSTTLSVTLPARAGVYFVKVSDGEKQYVQKIIVE